MGKSTSNKSKGDEARLRLRNMLMVALGQKKMFKRLIPATLHLAVYLGFLLINIEVLEIVLDGMLGTHRLFLSWMGEVYGMMINFFEFLAVLVIVACLVFIVRRHVLKVARFQSSEMRRWPKVDALLILLFEIALMIAILVMNGADQALQARGVLGYHHTGILFFSHLLVPIFQGLDTSMLIVIERVAWWLHIVGILSFGYYITYSKHLHLALAFPATFWARLMSQGKMINMDEVTTEVQSMLGLETSNEVAGEVPRLGAKDVEDLTRKNLLDAYSCSECGRCTSVCPANMTGKKLSPRKILMDTRDRMEEKGKEIKQGIVSKKALLGDFITAEEINACTTCNACTEACPINLNPLEIILGLRRYAAMEESSSPAQWNQMYSNIETSFSPWKFPAQDRFKWKDDLK
ncbi:(Fe-S)-binding protein [Aureibacter tunicatorum]|uniref:Heterodisulfide reductase subunit C n=1 Tax=Aureibacter tunicatorum TaxID=866807 RepID=A0AAE4BQU0_9BACT|nr:(Fe-S)-binding protein [Aureibacter tunicatorum]MDR6237941.1 heterodisulfide reductase subunit C [Aureibacter tunicatorum]